MLRLIFVSLLLSGASISVDGLSCRSGFNASIAGIPFFQWYQATCAQSSECFGHEITVTVQDLDVIVQYGGCISTAYSSLITCESLFGTNSELDPADLLNVIPNLDQNIQVFVQQFGSSITTNLQTLFTGGANNDEFIAGLFQFYGNIGFNTEKLGPLEAPLGKLFAAIFTQESNPQAITTATSELLTAILNLDTDNPGITADLYAFLRALGVDTSTIQGTPYAGLVEKLPGLFLSTFPASFEANRWYDEMFDLLSKVNITNPVQTVTDMIAIIKATDWVPTDYKTYTDKFLDRLPELVAQLVAGNSTYPGYWSTLLLMDYSETTTATTTLSNSIITFLTGLGVTSIPGELEMVIRYLPGHFYNYFPDKRSEINVVYGKIADGFNSFDFSNVGDTQPATSMSNFIISLIDNIAPGTLNDTSKLFIINFSYTFSKLLEPDYNDELDTFFNTLITGFANYPNFNLGQIVRDLVTNFGGTVPTEVEPLLTNIQNVVNTLVPTPDVDLMIQEMKKVIDAYEVAYPNSLFPAIAEGYIDYFVYLFQFNPFTATPQEIQEYQLESQLRAQLLAIDMQFAIVQVMDLSAQELENLLTSSFPAYGALVKALMVLEPDDVKQLVRDIATWIFNGVTTNPQSLTTQGFVNAVSETVSKITSELGDVVKDFRYVFSPNSCKSTICAADDCNTNQQISNQPAVTQAPLPPGLTTTGGSSKPASSCFAIVSLGMMAAFRML